MRDSQVRGRQLQRLLRRLRDALVCRRQPRLRLRRLRVYGHSKLAYCRVKMHLSGTSIRRRLGSRRMTSWFAGSVQLHLGRQSVLAAPRPVCFTAKTVLQKTTAEDESVILLARGRRMYRKYCEKQRGVAQPTVLRTGFSDENPQQRFNQTSTVSTWFAETPCQRGRRWPVAPLW